MDLHGFLHRLSDVAWRTEWLIRDGQIRAINGADPITFAANATLGDAIYRSVEFLDAAEVFRMDQRLALTIGQASDQANSTDPRLMSIRGQLIAILNPVEVVRTRSHHG